MENHSHPNYNIQLPYSKTNYLLTIPERRFYEKLCAMIPENLTILPQVAISSIVKVISHQITFKIRRKKISNKKIDFVIFKKRFLEPVLAIEYDDKTHERSDRKARDSFVNKVLDSSGIPIIHCKYEETNLSLHNLKKLFSKMSLGLKLDKNY